MEWCDCSALNLRPIHERRRLLEQNIKEVKNHIMLSEQTLIKVRVFDAGISLPQAVYLLVLFYCWLLTWFSSAVINFLAESSFTDVVCLWMFVVYQCLLFHQCLFTDVCCFADVVCFIDDYGYLLTA